MNNKRQQQIERHDTKSIKQIFDKKVFCRYCFNFSRDNIDFGLSGHEAKAAEHTNGELNQSKNETTAPSENKTTEKVDSSQLKDNTQTATADQPKVTMSDSATVKETSSNMQSPQNATANQSTTKLAM